MRAKAGAILIALGCAGIEAPTAAAVPDADLATLDRISDAVSAKYAAKSELDHIPWTRAVDRSEFPEPTTSLHPVGQEPSAARSHASSKMPEGLLEHVLDVSQK